MTSAGFGDLDIVKLLLKKGVDINTKNGISLVAAAARGAPYEMLKFLLENGANVNAIDGSSSTALMYEASRGNAEGVKLLIKYGADVNAKNTALRFAMYTHSSTPNRDEIVRLLIEAGAEYNVLITW